MNEYVRDTANFRNETAMRAGMIALVTVVLVGCSTAQGHEDTSYRDGISTHEIYGHANILDDTWDYLPGAIHQDGGLYVTSNDFEIAEQEGPQRQANPPLNLFGTHLQTTGDFAVDATINDRSGPADIQLYGAVPIIQDEFRIEPKSVRLRLDSDGLTATLWDGSSNQPASEQKFPIEASEAPNIGVEKHDSVLDITVNNKKVGTLADPGIFVNDEVWFGAEASGQDGHWLLSKVGVRGLNNATVRAVDTSSLHVETTNESQTLQHLATRQRPDFLFGAAMALGPMVSDRQYAETALTNFGAMTTENALKWQSVHPQKDTYNFAEGDALVKLAKRHNMAVHGHPLVFGEANPEWLQKMPTVTAEQKQAVHDVMIGHIRNVAGHYKNDIASWDVVNEPLTDEGKIRDHLWYKAMGESYIDEAFRAAHDVDPKAKLFINMYGIEAPGPLQDSMISLAKRLLARGVPIDGIGIQGHVYERRDTATKSEIEQAIKRFAALGLEVRISENDVYSDDGQKVQAEQYTNYLDACLKQLACRSYTTWGVSDRYNQWKDDDGSIRQGQDFLWDKNMKPTPAVTAIKSILQQ